MSSMEMGKGGKGRRKSRVMLGLATFDKTIRHPTGNVREAFGEYKWIWRSRERLELHR